MDEQKTPIEQVLDFSEEEVYLAALVEALLFSLGGPISRKELLEYCDTTLEKLERGIAYLMTYAPGRGIVPVESGDMLELRASAVASEIIEKARKESYHRDIGRAGMEVLAAVLYRGAQTRAEIDFIRGVNSAQTLRTLTTRGLVRKVPNPKDDRQCRYEPTTELLAHLGVAKSSEVPEYLTVRTQLDDLLKETQSK